MTAWTVAGYALGSAAALVLIVAGLALGWLAWRTHRLHKRGQRLHTHTDIEEGRDPEWT